MAVDAFTATGSPTRARRYLTARPATVVTVVRLCLSARIDWHDRHLTALTLDDLCRSHIDCVTRCLLLRSSLRLAISFPGEICRARSILCRLAAFCYAGWHVNRLGVAEGRRRIHSYDRIRIADCRILRGCTSAGSIPMLGVGNACHQEQAEHY
jgi:hypothetical protein